MDNKLFDRADVSDNANRILGMLEAKKKYT